MIKISFKNMEIGDLEFHAILKTEDKGGITAGTLVTKSDLEKKGLETIANEIARTLLNSLKKKYKELYGGDLNEILLR